MFGPGFERLLAGARQGDERAWTEFYLALAPVVRGYLAGQGCPAPEDVTSETMLQVVRDLHRFDGSEQEFRAGVFTIAHHRMVDARRRAQARPVDATEQPTLERHIAPQSFEDEAIANLGPGEIDHLLGAVTPDQRDVLLLRYVADLSLHQVAEVLGKEYDAVKALHRRALGALRSQLPAPVSPHAAGGALTSSG